MDNGAESYRVYLEGNNQGIIDIVERYKDGLILYLNHYVNNIYIAQDLCEDTFFRLMTKKPKYHQKSSFKTWLYAIARNIAIDYIRYHSKLCLVSIEDIEKEIIDMQSLELAYLKEDRKIAIHKALSKLSVDYRNVLWLVYFEDFSNKEVGIVMKKSERQVRNLIYRSKQALKIELEKDGFVYEDF